ncbi:hypothetical protein H0H92_010884, partial [Tricholoma furcatifolium]
CSVGCTDSFFPKTPTSASRIVYVHLQTRILRFSPGSPILSTMMHTSHTLQSAFIPMRLAIALGSRHSGSRITRNAKDYGPRELGQSAAPAINSSVQTGQAIYRKEKERMNNLPEALQFVGNTVMYWAVPKFHLPAHKPDCHGPFALNYMHGAARTDGEGVERNWSWLNGAAASTSQMGPGSRHDTLDDFIGYSNFRKIVDYGDTLLRNLVNAIPDTIMHHEAFRALTDGLRKEHGQQLVEWEKEVLNWEMDKTRNKDPYLVEEEGVSVHEIEHRLAEEERQTLKSMTVAWDVSPSTFIILGLALEGNQAILRIEAAKREKTTAQMSSLQRKRNAL